MWNGATIGESNTLAYRWRTLRRSPSARVGRAMEIMLLVCACRDHLWMCWCSEERAAFRLLRLFSPGTRFVVEWHDEERMRLRFHLAILSLLFFARCARCGLRVMCCGRVGWSRSGGIAERSRADDRIECFLLASFPSSHSFRPLAHFYQPSLCLATMMPTLVRSFSTSGQR